MINNGQLKASPLAKRFAIFAGVDISNVVGTGFNGKVKKTDVLNYFETAAANEPTKKITGGKYSFTTMTSAVDVSSAQSYSARINLRFPQINSSVAAIAAKAFIASMPDMLSSSIQKFQVMDLREKIEFKIPNEGKKVKISEIAQLCCVCYNPDFEKREGDTAYLLISNLPKSCESEKCSALFTLAFPTRKGQEAQSAVLMKNIKRYINDPVMLMI